MTKPVHGAFVFFSGQRRTLPMSGYRAATQDNYSLMLQWSGEIAFDEAHACEASYLVDDAPPPRDQQILQLREGSVIVGAVMLFPAVISVRDDSVQRNG